jgi:hypothetical protein
MLIRKIEAFMRHTKMPQTKFGRLAANDPQFVFDLKRGRVPRAKMERRVEHFMNTYSEDRHAH